MNILRFTLALVLIPATSYAEKGWELQLLGGWTAPTFSQRFSYAPDYDPPTIFGVPIEQDGQFTLDARGSFAFAGSITYFFNDHLGIEGRLDSVDFQVDTVAPRFTATIDLLPPLPPLVASADLGTGFVNVERLLPISINVKVRTGGRARFAASAGLSYLPRFRVDVMQQVGLGVTFLGINFVEFATIGLQAQALPEGSNLGLNLGAGVEFPVSERVAIVGEVRIFAFPVQTLEWSRSAEPTSPLEKSLLEQVESQLAPIELAPAYFHAVGGISLRF